MSDERIYIKTAGYSDEGKLTVDPGVSRCGDIKDGVGFEHDNNGGWVMSFKDLRKIYLAASEVSPMTKPTKADREAANKIRDRCADRVIANYVPPSRFWIATEIAKVMAPEREREKEVRRAAQKWRKHYRTHTLTCPGCNAAAAAFDKEQA